MEQITFLQKTKIEIKSIFQYIQISNYLYLQNIKAVRKLDKTKKHYLIFLERNEAIKIENIVFF
jgi:hypothetical protein